MEDYNDGDKIWIYDFISMTIEKGVILECRPAESCAYVSFPNKMHYMVDKKEIAPRNEKGKGKLKKIALQRAKKELEAIEKQHRKIEKRIARAIEELSRK